MVYSVTSLRQSELEGMGVWERNVYTESIILYDRNTAANVRFSLRNASVAQRIKSGNNASVECVLTPDRLLPFHLSTAALKESRPISSI